MSRGTHGSRQKKLKSRRSPPAGKEGTDPEHLSESRSPEVRRWTHDRQVLNPIGRHDEHSNVRGRGSAILGRTQLVSLRGARTFAVTFTCPPWTPGGCDAFERRENKPDRWLLKARPKTGPTLSIFLAVKATTDLPVPTHCCSPYQSRSLFSAHPIMRTKEPRSMRHAECESRQSVAETHDNVSRRCHGWCTIEPNQRALRARP